jgi:hypothetical protein
MKQAILSIHISLKVPAFLLFLFSGFTAEAIELENIDVKIWEPENTWIMMVGVSEWLHSDIYSNMPDPYGEDQKLYELFLKRGVPKDQIVFLRDKEATLRRINDEFISLLKKTEKDDTLFTYFTGHGIVDKDGAGYFANYDAPKKKWRKGTWSVAEIYNTIEAEFAGDTIFMMADCCYSGTLSEQLKALETEKAYACLSSSLSTLTSGMYWTFTESLISGFIGRPYVDSNSDGEITLRELKTYSRKDVAVFMQQETRFSTNEKFPQTFLLGTSLKKTHPEVGTYFEIKVSSRSNQWRKAKLVHVEGDEYTLLYYSSDLATYKKFHKDSRNLREFSRNCFNVDDLVDVKYKRTWYPAKILAIENETGIHTIRYENKKGWDGLYFYDDLRLRSQN